MAEKKSKAPAEKTITTLVHDEVRGGTSRRRSISP